MSDGLRKRKPVCYKEDDFFPSDDQSDDYVDSRKKKKPVKSRKKKDSDFRPTPAPKSRSKFPQRPRRRMNPSGPMSLNICPKNFADLAPDDLEHDPAGNPCRFVPFHEVEHRILDLESILRPGERGVLTFLPNFHPGNPKFLRYFGFTPELAKTELGKLQEMADDVLDSMLEECDRELARLPKPRETQSVAIPGFSTQLKDSIGINADVRTFDWARLGAMQKFDVITMDPPWQITVQNVTRGVNISYAQLDVSVISRMPIHHVQDRGFLFMWVIASQIANGVEMLKNWGYKIVAYMNWVKVSKYGRYMPSHGYYMQHNKETVLVGLKGDPPSEMNRDKFKSLIVCQRGVRQSHKPDAMYEMIEAVFPGQMYLEVFARPHNLRRGWVSIGIELPT